MSKRLGLVAMMLLVIASSGMVMAHEQNSAIWNGNYTIEPVHNTDINSISIQSIYASITQDATNWHYKTVSSYITSMNVDLNWGNSANSLRLKIYSPDGYIFGPYYDSFDGASNGRINLNIINSNGLAQGTWRYEVYGERVTGTQYYSI